MRWSKGLLKQRDPCVFQKKELCRHSLWKSVVVKRKLQRIKGKFSVLVANHQIGKRVLYWIVLVNLKLDLKNPVLGE